jgi:hypothetical protein
MRTRNLTSSACALLLTAGLAACSQSGDGPTAPDAASTDAAPSAPAQLSPAEREQRLQAWRSTTYGEQASADQAWRDRDNNRPLHRYQCLEEAVEIAGIQHSLVAICANRDDAAADEAGLLDLWLLRADANGGLETVDGRRGITLGSGGVVGELALIALGPDMPGVAIQAGVGDANQAMQGETVLVAADQGQLRQVARFASHYDNQAQLQCQDDADVHTEDEDGAATDSAAPAQADSPDCEAGLRQLRTQWQADTSSQRNGFWPLALTHSGVACGSAVIENLRLDYDPAQRHYPTPDLDTRCP